MRTVTGPANRFLLTKEVLEFCGDLPIYNTEISLAEIDADNGNASEQTNLDICSVSINRYNRYPLETTTLLTIKQQPQQQTTSKEKQLRNTFIYVRTVYHPVPVNCFTVIQTGRLRRQVGDVNVRNYTACNTNQMGNLAKCLNAPGWNLNCRMKSGSCYYWVTCKKTPSLFWICKEVHLSYRIPACCDFICP